MDTLKEAMAGAINEGMQTFDHALFQLYVDGRIGLDEALSNADSTTDLRLKIKMHEAAQGKEEKEETGFSLEES